MRMFCGSVGCSAMLPCPLNQYTHDLGFINHALTWISCIIRCDQVNLTARKALKREDLEYTDRIKDE